jgi:hypothetical protein
VQKRQNNSGNPTPDKVRPRDEYVAANLPVLTQTVEKLIV